MSPLDRATHSYYGDRDFSYVASDTAEENLEGAMSQLTDYLDSKGFSEIEVEYMSASKTIRPKSMFNPLELQSITLQYLKEDVKRILDLGQFKMGDFSETNRIYVKTREEIYNELIIAIDKLDL